MSQWTHSLCDACWNETRPGEQPARMKEAGRDQRELCCRCGSRNLRGIYIRQNPSELGCNGYHPWEESSCHKRF